MDTDLPVLLTVPMAAESLSMSRSRLYELISDRSITTVKIGSRRYVRRSDLAAFVAGLSDGVTS